MIQQSRDRQRWRIEITECIRIIVYDAGDPNDRVVFTGRTHTHIRTNRRAHTYTGIANHRRADLNNVWPNSVLSRRYAGIVAAQ